MSHIKIELNGDTDLISFNCAALSSITYILLCEELHNHRDVRGLTSWELVW